MGRRILQVDAFTDRLFGGNPAGVVPDAEGLDDRAMQTIAREMGCSETAFVFPATRADCTERVRFFTPGEEVPMCGHATIATYFVLAGEASANGPVRRTMECGAGALPIAITREGDRPQVTMTQNEGWFGPISSRDALADSIGIASDRLRNDLPAELASTGLCVAIAPVVSVDALAACRPDAAKIRAIGGEKKADGVYVVAFAPAGEAIAHARARFFCGEGLGIGEDPVTGSAAGALAAWLHRHGRLAIGSTLTIDQGIECGRPGKVLARIGDDRRASIAGSGVLVYDTTINV